MMPTMMVMVMVIPFAMCKRININVVLLTVRVAKCHEYDEYIRVKIFAGWGKKSGRRCNLG